MEWILRSPQMQSTFGNLAYVNTEGYHINENCIAALQNILNCILTEDKYLRSYRRSISFGQNVQRDLVPLLLQTKDDKVVELLIQILLNLSLPIECLVSVEDIAKTDFGRHMMFEINNLLNATKQAFIDPRVTKVVIEFLKKNLAFEQPLEKLSSEQITKIANALLLLRNILHIPEENKITTPRNSIQNQIMWNIFHQNIDKVFIKLMSIPEATNWSTTMVQLIALLYKDQHVGSLHKLLNHWMEDSFLEKPKINESNSTPNQGSEDSSPTSEPKSDSSENCQSSPCEDSSNPESSSGKPPTEESSSKPQNISPPAAAPASSPLLLPPSPPPLPPPPPPPPLLTSPPLPIKRNNTPTRKTKFISIPAKRKHNEVGKFSSLTAKRIDSQYNGAQIKRVITILASDYGKHIDNPEYLITSSSNEDKPFYRKPHNPMIRSRNLTAQDKKRKKIGKRMRENMINVRGLYGFTPTDEDISVILKQFTVEFVLNGYNYLVRTLHTQILNDIQIKVDTSHFFWLVMYFLKFATQIDLDFEYIKSVVSFDIVAYLIAESVRLSEQFEVAIKFNGNDLKPSIRRLHLVVTAIREMVQAIDIYKKASQLSDDNHVTLLNLQFKMCEIEDLKSLMVLLLRHYDPKYHNKQYLKDLIVTNHILLLFVENLLKLPNYKGNVILIDHLKQFATPKMMYQYGLLLADYLENGLFVNDCVFTLMHHVAGDMRSLDALIQPSIIKIFKSICQTEFEVCDEWSDLIKNVLKVKPQPLSTVTIFRLQTDNSDDDIVFAKPFASSSKHSSLGNDVDNLEKPSTNSSLSHEKWSESELSSLSWNYIQCNTSSDVVGEIIKIYKEEAVTKSRDSVINELFKQNIITKADFDSLLQKENNTTTETTQENKENSEVDITGLCEQLTKDGKGAHLKWVQKFLLDTCHAKIYLDKKLTDDSEETSNTTRNPKMLNFEMFKKKHIDLPLISPVCYFSLLADASVPLVEWNFEQVSMCKDAKFLKLLQKLGFQMPVDTGKAFIRIPHIWSAEYLYELAGKVLPIDTSKLYFYKTDLPKSGTTDTGSRQCTFNLSTDYVQKKMTLAMSDNYYQIQKENHLATMINYTPMPDPSYGYEGEANNISQEPNRSWLDIVQRSQEVKFTLHTESEAEDLDEQSLAVNKFVSPMSTVVIASTSTVVTDTTMTLLPTHSPCATEVTPIINCDDDDDDDMSDPEDTDLFGVNKFVSPMSTMVIASTSTVFTDTTLTLLPTHSPCATEVMPIIICDDDDDDDMSVCDSASIASDLTRMYVSDEDENPLFL